MKLWRITLISLASWMLTPSPLALGCASCGSGGDDPMILYPNEREKLYMGLGSVAGFRNIGPDGAPSTAGGPARKYLTTVAYGHSFSPRGFFTLTVPYVRNVRDDASRASWGDPSLSGRYTLIMTSIVEPWKPQVQIVGGYKSGFARSLRNTEEPKTLLDVFGSGFAETRVGLDLWYGQSSLLMGAAHLVSYPLARDYDGSTYQPGLTQRSTVTLGYRWAPHIKSLIGTNREAHAPLRIAHDAAPDSDQLNYSAFVTQDVMLDQLTMLRLTLSQQGAYGPIRNAARSSAVTAAYMVSF